MRSRSPAFHAAIHSVANIRTNASSIRVTMRRGSTVARRYACRVDPIGSALQRLEPRNEGCVMVTGTDLMMRHHAALELAAEWATLTDLAALVRALPRLDRVVTYDRLWIEHPTLAAEPRTYTAI